MKALGYLEILIVLHPQGYFVENGRYYQGVGSYLALICFKLAAAIVAPYGQSPTQLQFKIATDI